VSKVRNGFLGWHYVNRIDTCLFVSQPRQLSLGENLLPWEGRDESGTLVPAGQYLYYLWGYDNVSQKTLVTRYVPFLWEDRGTIETYDQDGKPLSNPIMYSSTSDHGNASTEREHVRRKWIIGGDPYDPSLVETCSYLSWADNGSLAWQPGDSRMFFMHTLSPNGIAVVRKYQWIPNGAAVMQYDWGKNGEYMYSVGNKPGWYYYPGVVSDGIDTLFLTNADIGGEDGASEIISLDSASGTENRRLDLSSWWVDVHDLEAGAQLTGGPTDLEYRNGMLAASSHTSCVHQLLNPYADPDEVVLYTNRNGDNIGDRNFEKDSPKAWACNDDKVVPYCYNTTLDATMFAVFPAYDIGAVSFGLLAPDGTGIGYFSFAGETAKPKWGEHCADYGSAYDGLYMNHTVAGESVPVWHYIAQDSFRGEIGATESVADIPSGAITVARNAPNPFNTDTTITFVLSKAGKVTVEVFNASGQKVDTILAAFLGAGPHSVTWNAVKRSAGVYLCTVKYGGHSRTVKMTLLK
jgi:hypothetical protein